MARKRHIAEMQPSETAMAAGSGGVRDEAARETVALLLATGAVADEDCTRLLEDLLRALRHRHAAGRLLDRVRQLEPGYPDGFFAGAVAGFILGQATGEVPSPAAATGKAGVSDAPCKTAQTGAGGLGYLETPEDDDERD